MTQRFPHDFWSGRNLETEPAYRWDASRPRDLGRLAPYGLSLGHDWEPLAPAEPNEDILRHFVDETVLDELDDEPIDDGPHACLVEDLHPAGARAGLFIPEKYEPNYPYPLVVWFHDAGGDEEEWLSLMPRVSERNAFGLSLQGPMSAGNAARAAGTGRWRPTAFRGWNANSSRPSAKFGGHSTSTASGCFSRDRAAERTRPFGSY